MNLQERLKGDPKFQGFRRFELDSIEEADTADLPEHFIFSQSLDEDATEPFTCDRRASTKLLFLEDIERRQAGTHRKAVFAKGRGMDKRTPHRTIDLSLIHISEPTRRTPISYAVFCLKKKK